MMTMTATATATRSTATAMRSTATAEAPAATAEVPAAKMCPTAASCGVMRVGYVTTASARMRGSPCPAGGTMA